LTAAGNALQVPADAALHESATVPVGVAPLPVHVVVDVTVVVRWAVVPSKTTVGVAVSVVVFAVEPLTVKVAVVVPALYAVLPP
jgi:hypothetical protein